MMNLNLVCCKFSNFHKIKKKYTLYVYKWKSIDYTEKYTHVDSDLFAESEIGVEKKGLGNI